MRFLATAEQGVYLNEDDEFDGVHPDLLDRYYGADGPIVHRQPGQTGAGHEGDIADERGIAEEVGARIGLDQQANVRHAAVDAPNDSCPFVSVEAIDLFYQALTEAEDQDIIPNHLMVTAEEWPDGYPTHELITTGTRSGKKLSVALPYDIWWPRAVVWARALRIMQQFIMDFEA